MTGPSKALLEYSSEFGPQIGDEALRVTPRAKGSP